MNDSRIAEVCCWFAKKNDKWTLWTEGTHGHLSENESGFVCAFLLFLYKEMPYRHSVFLLSSLSSSRKKEKKKELISEILSYIKYLAWLH